ncbi:hypothetical protein CEF21_05635 [Bacillus sp. FJAT-42376]|uniref:hypothetical protein n=1 Tax=Bacillus sp. FJAT-42376 TaxID=2014076 RepID=UPI000F509485|nr:hypothetical protein [Bacillus sp. FJAT-42376]AZB41826.1 hypothetical protein CEF21_05635 [Bacillus sp. FJAT-42376]
MKNKMKFGFISAIALSASISFQAHAASSPLSTANIAGEQLKKATSAFAATTDSGDVYTINENYDAFTKRLSYTESTIGKVPGAAVRKSLYEKYVTPAKKVKERVIYEVSETRLLGSISKSTLFNKEEKAKLDLKKLNRLKTRAVEIKKDGGYAAVPQSIVNELTWLEDYLKVAAADPFYKNSKKFVLMLDFDPSSKQAMFGGIKIGDSRQKVKLLLGEPITAYGNDGWEYDYNETAYGGEFLGVEFKGGKSVSALFYTARSDKNQSFSKEFADAYPGDLYQSTDSYNKKLKVNSLFVLNGTGKDFVYLQNFDDTETVQEINHYVIQDKNKVSFINVNSKEDFTRVPK